MQFVFRGLDRFLLAAADLQLPRPNTADDVRTDVPVFGRLGYGREQVI